MRRKFLILMVFFLLLSSCTTQQGEDTNFPEISTPVVPTLTVPPTEGPAATLPPTEVATQVTQPTITPTQAPSEPFLGLHVSGIPPQEQIGLLPRPDGLWFRTNLIFWDKIEPVKTDPPTYDWSVIDEAALGNMGASGVRTLAVIQFAPGWAQKFPPSACGPIAEQELARFGQFMNALVSRYSQPPYNIHYWELGNEPDVDRGDVGPRSVFGCWGDKSDPNFGGGYYAEMLKAVYPQVKAADPQSQVIIGGLLLDCDPVNPVERTPGSGDFRNCIPANFLEGILANGGGDFFDGVSFHSYDYYMGVLGQYTNGNWHSSWETTGPALIAKTRFLRSVLEKYGYNDKLLLNTELALICGRDGSEPECQTEEYTLSKAYYMAHANFIGLQEGLDANVWYSLFGWRGSGLVNRKLEQSPAFQAFLYVSDQIDGAVIQSEITQFPGVKGYEYTRNGVRTWIIWSQDGQAISVSLPEMPATIFDVFGSSQPTSQELSITAAPLYIQWNP